MALAYFSNEEAVLRKKTEVLAGAVAPTPVDSIREVYEVERCLKYIKEKRCKKVALQFPDSLLIDASSVARQLERESHAKIYILADTSYGHCDVDEVNANHVAADLIIHYGESALTPSAKIPTLFVFGRHPSDIDSHQVCQVFHETFPSKDETRIVFLHHVSCDFIAGAISDLLLPEYPYLSIGQLNIPDSPGGATGQKLGKEERNILKELCTKSCPGCPCRLEKEKDSGATENSSKFGQKNKVAMATGQNRSLPRETEIEMETDSVADSSINSMSSDKSSNNSNAEQKSAKNGDGLLSAASVGGHELSKMEVEQSTTATHLPDCKEYETGCYRIPLETDKELSDYIIFYLGPSNSQSLKNLTLSHPTCSIHIYDPSTKICEKLTTNNNRQLMKRYYLVEKAKDAKIVGILAGTMGVAGYLDCVNYMKQIGKAAGKKTYTFIVGKLNPEKLANFMEIDIFVLVANPENSILDSSNFYRPVVTPYEFEVACNPNREWSKKYITDFRDILLGGSDFVEFPTDYEAEEGTAMSLITGNIRTSAEIEDCPEVNITNTASLALRNEKTALEIFGQNSAAHHLSERSWKGLEQKLGETSVEKAKMGRSGLPVSYNSMTDF